MLDNCTITNTSLAKPIGEKKAKMASAKILNMKDYRDKLFADNNKTEQNTKLEANEPVNTMSTEVEPVVNTEEAKVEEKEVEVAKVINFPTNEEYEARLQQIGVETYQNLYVKRNLIINSTRRLRVNNLVVLSVARVRDYVSKVMEEVKGEVTEEVEEASKTTFDFSQLSHMNTETQEDVSTKPTLSVDDYFKKENEVNDTTQKETEDTNIVEINSLTKENANLRYIVESKKEELANILKVVESNERLCEDRKRELREENLALTQELTDLLAMIDQKNDLISQQEAFLNEESSKRVA